MRNSYTSPWRIVLVGALGLIAPVFVGCQRKPPADDVTGGAVARAASVEQTSGADTAASTRSETSVTAGDGPTFNRSIAAIVFAKCSTCHRPGEAAPFSLMTYEDVRRRASQIADVTQRRFMPPWLPQEGHGEFVGARRLTDQEIQTIAAWARAAAPRGDESDLPATPTFVDGWQLGTPDLVIESPPYVLTGQGGDVFRNFVVPVPLKSPRWIRSIELRPTNPRVTHHARLGIDDSYESVRRDAQDDQPGYEGMAWGQDPDGQLVVWVPGMVAAAGTPGTAWRLHPQTCLVLHAHLQPSGKPETVQFRIGVHFADEPPRERPVILRIGSRDIDIPAGAARHRIVDQYELPIELDVQSILPHAHSLCQDLHVWAELPDGSRQSLIRIERFDEKWHDKYRYVRPVRLPRGTKLVSEFVYDNTDANVRNRHHPPRRVVYGSNVDDEMADVFLQVSAVHADQRAVLTEDQARREQQSKIVGYRTTLEAYPRDPWSQEGLAACYIGLQRSDEAIRLLEERVKSGPAETHSLVMLGMAHFSGANYERAEELQRQALGMDSAYPLAWLGLGKALAARRKPDEAERAYRRAVELAPGLTEAHLSLVDLLLQSGRLDEAATACDSVIAISPDQPTAYLKLGEIRARQKRFDESLREFETAQRLAPYTHPPKVLLAATCFKIGEVERARTLLRAAAAESPNHPVPALFLGQLARGERQWDACREHFNAAASRPLPANWPESHRKRFLVLLHSEQFRLAQQLEDPVLARASLAEWLKCEPDNKQLQQAFERLKSAKGQ